MSQQLVKKGTNGKHENVMPRSWIEAIKDKNTGQTLVEILQGFNMYFLPYNGNTSSTRCLVPTILRKKGLWITYVKYDGNVYTEWYAADEIDDKSWGDSSNWRIGNNTLVGDITISANGNWVINGTETKFKAVGEKGNTPLVRFDSNNKFQVSYNNGDKWLDISDSITNNLRIKKYIGINESLPTSGVEEGTIYMKGPYYDENDTLNENPIYRMWVYAWKGNTLAWQDNGEFTSIAAGIVQETGYSETEVMSQKVVSEKLSELSQKLNGVIVEITDEWNNIGEQWKNTFLKYPIKAGEKYHFISKTLDTDRNGRFLFTAQNDLTVVQYIIEPLNRSYGNIDIYFIASSDADGIVVQTDNVINTASYTLQLVKDGSLEENFKSFEAEVVFNNELTNKRLSELNGILAETDDTWNDIGKEWKKTSLKYPIKSGETYHFVSLTNDNDRNGRFLFTEKNGEVIQYIIQPGNRYYGDIDIYFTAIKDADAISIQTDVVTNIATYNIMLVKDENLKSEVHNINNEVKRSIVDASFQLEESDCYVSHSTGIVEYVEGYVSTKLITINNTFTYIYSGKAEYAVANYAFYDEKQNFISAVPVVDGNVLTDYILSDIPSNAKYIRFSGVKSSFKLKIKSIFDNSYGFHPVPGYVNYHNGIFEELVADKYCTTEYILIDKDKDYIYSGKAEYGGANYAFYDANKNFISAVPTSDGNQLHNYKVENVPSNAKYVRFSGIATTFKLSIENKVVLPIPTSLSKLVNKTILFNGDSLCESRLDSSKNEYNGGAYAKLISDRVGCIYHNRGRSGAVLISGAAPSGYNPDRHIVNDVKNMQQDCDIICFEGGINDWSTNVPIGEVSEYFSRDFDETTVIGALEAILYQAKVKWIGKPIVFIISHQCREASWKKNNAVVPYSFAELRRKMIEVCDKWSIPYFDAFSKSGLNGNLDEYGSYLNSNPSGTIDGWHPNKDGYERFYVPQLIALFESLI